MTKIKVFYLGNQFSNAVIYNYRHEYTRTIDVSMIAEMCRASEAHIVIDEYSNLHIILYRENDGVEVCREVVSPPYGIYLET